MGWLEFVTGFVLAGIIVDIAFISMIVISLIFAKLAVGMGCFFLEWLFSGDNNRCF